MGRDVDNNCDLIDSRDLMERIEELEGITEGAKLNEADGLYYTDDGRTDVNSETEELETLRAFAKEFEDCAPDYKYGETAVRYSYFKDYAKQLAEDIGAVNSDAKWPNNCIDWDEAARQLKQDYTEIDFDGVAYFVR